MTRGIANLENAFRSVVFGLSSLNSGEDRSKACLHPSVGPMRELVGPSVDGAYVRADSNAGAIALYA